MATVSTKIEVEGAGAFKKNFQEASMAVKAANSELKYFSDELNRTGKTEQNFTNQQKALEKAIKAEADAIAVLEEKIAQVSEKGGKDAEKQIDRLTSELYKHKNAQADLQHQMDTLGDQAEETGNQFGTDMADDIAKATVILEKTVDLAIQAAKKIVEIGKNAVSYNAEMESYERTIEAFFKTSGQSAAQASKNTKDLIARQKQLSSVLGISSSALIDANKMLIASGVEGERSQEAIEGLAKAIVATGGGANELSRMSQNLQQISNTGRASAQDLKQFAAAGVDVYGLMADSTGKTVEQLKDMDVTFDMIVDALSKATEEGGKFYEASLVGTQTLNGQMSLLQTEIQEGLGTAFLPVNEALKNELIPAAREFIEQIDWNAVGAGLATAVGLVTDFVHGVQEFMNWYDSVYGEPAQVVVDGFTASQEELNKVFAESAGNMVIFGEEMAGAMEKSKGLGNHMQMEFDGFAKTVDTSLQDTAREVREYIEQDGWNLMSVGITSMDYLAQGMENNADAPVITMNDIASTIDRSMGTMTAGGFASGVDMITGFADGMTSPAAQSALVGALEQTANTIDAYLGFSVPEKGVLSHYESWMPDFIGGLAKGIKNSMYMIEDAASSLAQTINNNAVTNNISMSIYGQSGQSASDIADLVMIRIQQATDSRKAVWA